jgi:hypothetical protein
MATKSYMMRLSILVLFTLLISTFSNAQDYQTGLGLRGGTANGITVKHFLGESDAVEGIFSSRWRGFSITGLYERHMLAFQEPGLKFFYGGGGHIGFWDNDRGPWDDDDFNDGDGVIGVDGIIGLEYTIDQIPLNIGIDWKPGFNLIGHTGFWGDGIGLSVRYTFK